MSRKRSAAAASLASDDGLPPTDALRRMLAAQAAQQAHALEVASSLDPQV